MQPTTHDEMKQSVIDGDVERAQALAQALVDGRGDLWAAIDEGCAAGIRTVGELWDDGEYFLPELVQGAAAMKAAMVVQRELAEAVQASRLSWNPRLLVGSAPATATRTAQIGAEYAENALQAVAVAVRMLS